MDEFDSDSNVRESDPNSNSPPETTGDDQIEKKTKKTRKEKKVKKSKSKVKEGKEEEKDQSKVRENEEPDFLGDKLLVPTERNPPTMKPFVLFTESWSKDAKSIQDANSNPDYIPKFQRILDTVDNPKQKDLMVHIKDVMESELYEWDTFPLALPQSAFSNLTPEQKKALFNLFQVPSNDELDALAKDEHGNFKKLSKEQLQQVRKSGKFDVPSVAFAGKNHVWQLSGLLLKGTENINSTLLDNFATAASHFVIQIPDRLWRDSPINILNGIISIGMTFYDLCNLVIGLPQTIPKYPDSMVIDFNKRYLLQECKKKSENILVTKDGLEIHLYFWDQKLRTEMETVLRTIESRCVERWSIDKYTFASECEKKLNKKDMTEAEVAQKIHDMCCEEQNKRIFDAVRNSKELESVQPGLSKELFKYYKAKLIYDAEVTRLFEEREKKRNALVTSLMKQNPIRGRINQWVNRKVDEEMSVFDKKNVLVAESRAHEEFHKDDELQEYSYLLGRHLEYEPKLAAKDLEMLKKEKQPEQTITWKVRIWRPSKWKITKREDYSGFVTYSLDKTETVSLPSSWFGWRILMHFIRFYVWMNNVLFWLIAGNMWSGPLSIRALFKSEPFYPDMMVDQSTGVLVASRHPEILTFPYRISALWKSAKESRDSFEATPDSGFIGKSVSRIFNIIWNWFFKALIGSFLVILGQPLLTFLNLIVTLILILTSIVWVPMGIYLHSLFCIFIYNYDAHNFRMVGVPWLPVLFIVIWTFLVKGILRPIAALFLAILVHPLVAFFVFLFAVIRAFARHFYDAFIFGVVVKPRSRIPARNTFLARRVEGPGLSYTLFQQIAPEEALVALQITLEMTELDIYTKQISSEIDVPSEKFKSFMDSIFGPFGARMQNGTQFYARVTKQAGELQDRLTNMKNDRLKDLPKLPRNSQIRQTSADLKETISRGQVLVEEWFTMRVFPTMNENSIRNFWLGFDLRENNWVELTKKLLARSFSADFLQPFEDVDKSLKLQVDRLNVKKFIRMIERAQPRNPLDTISAILFDNNSIVLRNNITVVTTYVMLVNRSDPFLPLESKIFDQLFRRRKNGKDSKAKMEKMGSYGTFKDEDVLELM